MTDDLPDDPAAQETVLESDAADSDAADSAGSTEGNETLERGGLATAAADCEPSDLDELRALLNSAAGERLPRVARLARGGMGTIDLVKDLALKRRLAKKRVLRRLREDVEVLRALVREAQITGQLDHPSIVPVHELGIDASGDLYFTMKVVEGVTLSDHRRTVVDTREHDWLFELLEIVIKICDALAFAHNRNIVHLDVKPSNVMVGEFGQVYLMDWGIARPPA